MAKEAIGVRFKRSLTPHNHEFGNLIFGVVVATLKTASVIEFGVERPQHHLRRHHAGLITCIARLRICQVGRAENGKLEVLRKHAIAARAHKNCHGFTTILFREPTPVIHD